MYCDAGNQLHDWIIAWDTLAQVHGLHFSRLDSWSICHTDSETVFVFQIGGKKTMLAISWMNVKKCTKIKLGKN